MKCIVAGAGASSIAVLFNLLEAIALSGNKSGLEKITLIDKAGNFGPGIAYGTVDNVHLFNSRAGSIGIVPEQKAHFFDWVLANKENWEGLFPDIPAAEISGDSFLPRRLFGMYLKDMLVKAEAKAKSMGIAFDKITAEITDIAEHGENAFVKTNEGEVYEGEKIIVSTGNPPANRIGILEGNPKYFPSLWPSANIGGIPKDAAIIAIGTGLTAVDLLLSLKASGHQGKITLISSSGQLPEVHPGKSLPPYLRKILTIENARAMEAFSADAYYKMLQGELDAAQKDAFDRRSVIDSLRIDGAAKRLWNMLTQDEQKKWDTHYGSWYSGVRFRMPPQSWEKIKPMLDSGQAHIIKGRVGASFKIDGSAYYINCSGHNFYEDRLIQSMIQQGVAVCHPSGGLSADEMMYVKRPDGTSSNAILAIGALRRGEDFEANAIPEIVAQAAKIIQSILARHGSSKAC